MSRLLGIDYGTKRTGIAVTDQMRIICSPLETVETKKLIEFLQNYLVKNEVAIIVLGLPLRLNGEPSDTHKKVMELEKKLNSIEAIIKNKIKITLYDERFTSVMAKRIILESGIGKEKRKDKSLVDKISASILLESYMLSVSLK